MSVRRNLLLALIAALAFYAVVATVAERFAHEKAELLSKQLDGAHAASIQTCLLNDEAEAECVARWERAVSK